MRPVDTAQVGIDVDYQVYCDESRHTQPVGYMGLGGVWLPASRRRQVNWEVRRVMKTHRAHGEVKWHRTSWQVLDAYRAIVDVFFDEPDSRARVMVVEHALVDDGFHAGDAELGFYKFYYEMIEKWIDPQHAYNVLLDFKQNRETGRHTKLLEVLQTQFGSHVVRDVNVIDSGETPIAMVCDLLTGAVAAAWSGDISQGGPKEALAAHIRERAGHSLLAASPTPDAEKLNIFRLRLRQRPQE